MARQPSPFPTELELEILKILWRDGPASVRQVQDRLASSRKLAVTSVTTVMNIMADKGYVSRAKTGGRYVYRPRVSEALTSRRMLGDLVERVFDGSAAAVMLNLLETADLGHEELRQLQRLIRRKAKEQNP
jgi:predicted transcriptional regulator